MISKTYSITNDVVIDFVDTERLKVEIESSSITIQIKEITTSGDNLYIEFKVAISATEELVLDTVVANHSGLAVEHVDTIHTVADIPEGGKRKTDRGFIFTATAGQTTTFDYVVGENLQIKGGLLQTCEQNCQDAVHMEIVDHNFIHAGSWYPATPFEYGIPGTEGLSWSQVLPTGLPLHAYIRDFPVSIEGRTKVKNDAITTTPLNGLTIRMHYVSRGTVDVPCNVGIVAYT